MKLTITKPNGTILEKDVDSKDKDYIKKLEGIGWKKIEPKPKPKTKTKKSKKK